MVAPPISTDSVVNWYAEPRQATQDALPLLATSLGLCGRRGSKSGRSVRSDAVVTLPSAIAEVVLRALACSARAWIYARRSGWA
jgi:hypothetical protein